jgi:polar amino acid transport system permease protein
MGGELGFGPTGWAPALLSGALITIEITIGAFACGLVIGVLTAAARLSGLPPLVLAARAYTTVCRALPELLMILVLYYLGSELLNDAFVALGLGIANINGFATAIVVLGLVQGAYAAEVIRGAILAIPQGQIEAARAFGLSGWQLFRRVVLPMMLPVALGGLSNLWMVLIKDSALISVVGYSELLYTAKQAAGYTHQYFLFYIVAAALYYVMTLVSNGVIRLVEDRIGRWMPAATVRGR